jgi:hypothetical protein
MYWPANKCKLATEQSLDEMRWHKWVKRTLNVSKLSQMHGTLCLGQLLEYTTDYRGEASNSSRTPNYTLLVYECSEYTVMIEKFRLGLGLG